MSASLQKVSTQTSDGTASRPVEVTQFRQFDDDFYIGVVRKRGDGHFRAALISINDTENVYISKANSFIDVKNPSYEYSSYPTFRNDILSALALPKNNKKYDVLLEDNGYYKQIEIFRIAESFNVKIGSIKLYPNTERLKNKKWFYRMINLTLSFHKDEERRKDALIVDLQRKYNESLKIVAESTKMQQRFQSELMEKFVQILNEKKKKIVELKREIERLQNKQCKVELTQEEDDDNDSVIIRAQKQRKRSKGFGELRTKKGKRCEIKDELSHFPGSLLTFNHIQMDDEKVKNDDDCLMDGAKRSQSDMLIDGQGVRIKNEESSVDEDSELTESSFVFNSEITAGVQEVKKEKEQIKMLTQTEVIDDTPIFTESDEDDFIIT